MPKRLLAAVGSIFHVEFVLAEEINSAGLDAALLFGVPRDEAEKFAQRGVRSMAFLPDSSPIAPGDNEIKFSAASFLAQCLRSRKLSDKSLTHVAPLKAKTGDEIVASRRDDPFWMHRTENGVVALDLVAAQPNELSQNDYLYKHLEKDNWARLLPLLHFMREVSGWQPPPIRACFMFDDPNLHWKSYGYIRYRELAQHAAEHNYHAAFATIPMDSWFVHGETAAIFREGTDRISLLFHGNNHTYYELTETNTDRGREALAAQAIRRIERLERVSGIEVSRAMAAPHGACNSAMGDVLLRCGFEVACISRSSLMIRNPETPWASQVGMNPAEFLGEGLPVIPRFNIRWDTTYALFAAFLGQPIILVGHHDDLASGFNLLEEWAQFINSFGKVSWTDVQSMSRANFCLRRTDGTLEMEMFSRKVALTVPAGGEQLCIERPWLGDADTEEVVLERESGAQTVETYRGELLPVKPGERLVITSIYPDMIDLSKISTSLPGPWAVARRQLCEVRDRFKPVISKLKGGRKQDNAIRYHQPA